MNSNMNSNMNNNNMNNNNMNNNNMNNNKPNEILINTIKEWVKLDNELRTIKKEEKIRKETKKQLSMTLIELMRDNKVDCIDINNGQLCYTHRNIKKPLNKKNLMLVLSKYFKGNEIRATELNDYILNNREEVVKESIIRKITN